LLQVLIKLLIFNDLIWTTLQNGLCHNLWYRITTRITIWQFSMKTTIHLILDYIVSNIILVHIYNPYHFAISQYNPIYLYQMLLPYTFIYNNFSLYFLPPTPISCLKNKVSAIVPIPSPVTVSATKPIRLYPFWNSTPIL